ncbi:predicted GPI-anchored protein 58 isoform X2 [Triticum aestivum]|uniref:predicted GPI-anchored protein 58 isoform X2 n=1 Tax=Triticum aestivum TaxID=4565 RepID=UPI001D0197CB|nr:predicted GPI-anchored protein 58 isoform X2 [Triticum aestivum]
MLKQLRGTAPSACVPRHQPELRWDLAGPRPGPRRRHRCHGTAAPPSARSSPECLAAPRLPAMLPVLDARTSSPVSSHRLPPAELGPMPRALLFIVLRRLESSVARAKSRRSALVPLSWPAPSPASKPPAAPQPSSSMCSSPRARTSLRPCPRTTRSASASHLLDVSSVRFAVVAPCIAVACCDLLCFVHAPVLPEGNEQRSPCSICWHALTVTMLRATSTLRPNRGLLSGPVPVSTRSGPIFGFVPEF